MENFAEIYKKYVRQVYIFLWKLCEDELLAEELTQRVFYKAFLHIDKFEQRCKLTTWLCAIARNEWLLECRKNKGKISLDVIKEMVDNRNIEEEIERKEQLVNMRKAIMKLSDQYQEILQLHVYANLSFHEIALLFSKSDSWAKVTYLRAKQKIKLILEENR